MITRDDVAHVAHLARLTLTEDELDQFAKEMYDAMLANLERLEQPPPKD